MPRSDHRWTVGIMAGVLILLSGGMVFFLAWPPGPGDRLMAVVLALPAVPLAVALAFFVARGRQLGITVENGIVRSHGWFRTHQFMLHEARHLRPLGLRANGAIERHLCVRLNDGRSVRLAAYGHLRRDDQEAVVAALEAAGVSWPAPAPDGVYWPDRRWRRDRVVLGMLTAAASMLLMAFNWGNWKGLAFLGALGAGGVVIAVRGYQLSGLSLEVKEAGIEFRGFLVPWNALAEAQREWKPLMRHVMDRYGDEARASLLQRMDEECLAYRTGQT